jgi:hypothetical protein
MELICIDCKGPRDKGRKRCRACYLEFSRLRAKERYKQTGFERTTYSVVCVACKEPFKSTRKISLLCSACIEFSKTLCKGQEATNKYKYIGYTTKNGKKHVLHEHRVIVENLFKRELTYNEVIRHLDENPKNNILTNLIVLSRKDHVKLHKFLNIERIIFEKSKNDRSSLCWDELRQPLTVSWLETTKTNTIKVWEINQVAS